MVGQPGLRISSGFLPVANNDEHVWIRECSYAISDSEYLSSTTDVSTSDAATVSTFDYASTVLWFTDAVRIWSWQRVRYGIWTGYGNAVPLGDEPFWSWTISVLVRRADDDFIAKICPTYF
jgi:hypothetical protein